MTDMRPPRRLPRDIALDDVTVALQAARGLDAAAALPHLRLAADRLTAVIDDSMAEAVLVDQVSIRSVGAAAGLTENAVPPRLGRTARLAAYADDKGRVTASAVQRARYDDEIGSPRPTPPTTPMRFKPRRPTT